MLGTSGAVELKLNLPFLSTLMLSMINHSPLLDCSSTSVVESVAPSMVPSMWNLFPLQAVSVTMASMKRIFFIMLFIMCNLCLLSVRNYTFFGIQPNSIDKKCYDVKWSKNMVKKNDSPSRRVTDKQSILLNLYLMKKIITQKRGAKLLPIRRITHTNSVKKG